LSQPLHHRIFLAAQPGNQPVLGQGRQGLVHRLGAVRVGGQARVEMHQVLEHVEQAAEPPQFERQGAADQPDPGLADPERHELLQVVGVAETDVLDERHGQDSSMPKSRPRARATPTGQ
jgi:hypothetical protein